MAEPAGRARAKLRDAIRPHVQVRRAWATAQPLDRPAAGEVDAERRHVDGNRARRLVAVEQHHGADRLGARDHRGDVLDRRAAEQHVRDGHDERALVDGLEQRLHRRVHAVAGTDDDDLGAAPPLLVPHVAHRRKIERREDDLVALARVVEAARHERLDLRHVRRHHHRALRRADDAPDALGRAVDLGQPVFPRVDALVDPQIGVRLQVLVRAARHGAERVRHHVDRSLQRRETRRASAAARRP